MHDSDWFKIKLRLIFLNCIQTQILCNGAHGSLIWELTITFSRPMSSRRNEHPTLGVNMQEFYSSRGGCSSPFIKKYPPPPHPHQKKPLEKLCRVSKTYQNSSVKGSCDHILWSYSPNLFLTISMTQALSWVMTSYIYMVSFSWIHKFSLSPENRKLWLL